jgi:cytochrome c oxidase cbb3-type subunit 4
MLHDDLVWLAKSAGLFYLVGLSILIVAWVYWPSNKKRYEQAASAILQDDDRPLP